ncbi:hypothetical protein [Lysobacter sp. Root604]|uniref:hypothetical protein n=1 Tax=Lysobacter sp. Root604 TaxID=1736568 RepID=UPI000AB9FB0F|nr:hypothetical protein [Lysobacter sp. Root604]
MRAARRCLLLSLLSMAAPLPAMAADCQSRVYELLQAAYPGAQGETGDNGDNGELLRLPESPARWINLGEVVCKVWPAAPDKTLLALKLQHEAATDLEVEPADLELLVADSARPRILQRYREANALDSDAIRVSGLSLDTARYRLDERTTAFGLRVSYTGASRANPYSSTSLSLYVPDGARLRPVLSRLQVALDRGEWDTQCAGEFESVQRTVAIDGKRDHGYAGLLVASSASAHRNEQASDGQCSNVESPARKSRERLYYDGREYAVPPALRGLD